MMACFKGGRRCGRLYRSKVGQSREDLVRLIVGRVCRFGMEIGRSFGSILSMLARQRRSALNWADSRGRPAVSKVGNGPGARWVGRDI
jgi:hypothetical protein